jgi:hypothetical protein
MSGLTHGVSFANAPQHSPSPIQYINNITFLPSSQTLSNPSSKTLEQGPSQAEPRVKEAVTFFKIDYAD